MQLKGLVPALYIRSMSISSEQVTHIARLARLSTDSEKISLFCHSPKPHYGFGGANE